MDCIDFEGRGICFREIFQNYEIREIYHKNSLIWNMNNSYTHHCIKETFLQCFGNRLCLWRQILGLKKIVFKSRNGDDREIRENKLSRKKWKVQSRKLIVAKICFHKKMIGLRLHKQHVVQSTFRLVWAIAPDFIDSSIRK